MTDNLSTDKQDSQVSPVTNSHTPSLAATTPPVVASTVVESNVVLPDTTSRKAASNVTPPVGEAPQSDTGIDPRVVALRAMFPDYDDLILISVLESVGGSQDRAIDTLLGMSDPEYKGEPPAAVYVQQQQPALSQTELDEEFARHLMLEEQQQQQQQWVNANQRQPVMYQSHPSQRRWNSQAQPGEAGVEADKSVGDLQEQFSKIAESGKKTIGNLFSKVKAKIQEFDQGRSPGQASDSSTQPTWGSQGQAQSAAVAQPSYFDPNPHPSPSSIVSSPPIAHKSSPVQATPVLKGYDWSPNDSPPERPELLPPAPAMNSPASRSSSGGTLIDAGKLGLLPKRPVSLLRDPAATGGNGSSSNPSAALPQSQPTRKVTEDDDGLEYTENPFEEHAGPEKKR